MNSYALPSGSRDITKCIVQYAQWVLRWAVLVKLLNCLAVAYQCNAFRKILNLKFLGKQSRIMTGGIYKVLKIFVFLSEISAQW